MNTKTLFNILVKAINYKRTHKLVESIVKYSIKEGKEVAKRNTEVGLQDKRKRLKMAYSRILKNTPYTDKIEMFHGLIDQVPEEYLDYELNINLDKAMEMVQELIGGNGLLTAGEMKNLGNIVQGIGLPAIAHYASGNEKMDKETQEFGSREMNKNVDEFLGSLERRRNPVGKLPSPERKQIETRDIAKPTENRSGAVSRGNIVSSLFKMPEVEKKNSKFWKLASQISASSPGINADRIAKSVMNIANSSKSYEQAKKQAKSLGYEENLFKQMYEEFLKEKQGEEVKK